MRKVLLVVLVISCLSVHSQNIIKFEEKNSLVSTRAFSKIITKDFSYLVYDNFTPQQGVSASLKNNETQVLLNGTLYSGSFGVVTANADLSATNGVYFFDSDNGGRSAQIGINYFKNYHQQYVYRKVDRLDNIALKFRIFDLILKAKTKFEFLERKLEILGKQDESLQDVDKSGREKVRKKIMYLVKTHINDQNIEAYDKININLDETLEKKYEKFSDKNLLIKLGAETDNLKEKISYQYNYAELVKDYFAQKEYILKKLEDEIVELEIDLADKFWTSKHLWFLSAHPFYKRETFERYDEDITEISNRFSTIMGDVFGLNFYPINYSYQNFSDSKEWFRPTRLLLRGGVRAARISNRDSFKISNITSTQIIEENNGNSIVSIDERQAFIGDNRYEYGHELGVTIDAFYFPTSLPVGLFGNMGYSLQQYSRASGIGDKERIPLRLGFLIGIKKAKSEKDLVSLQLFMDRTDLNLSPNGEDNDLRFGLGIGVPINFK